MWSERAALRPDVEHSVWKNLVLFVEGVRLDVMYGFFQKKLFFLIFFST
jgi:hypothetical protein